MLKKLIIFCFSLAFTAGLFAQSGDATISASQIRYWIGSGSNEVIFAVNFGSPDTCLAWGYRFNADSITVEEMMDSIAANDSRFSYSGSTGVLNNITFTPVSGTTFTSQNNFWMYNVNGSLANWGYNQQYVLDGDLVKWGDADVATYTETSGWPWVYEWSQTVTPVDPPAGAAIPDATIDPTQIKYWVGNGNNEVVFAVNWANPDTCLAWGYRFSADSVLVSDMMNDIQAADYRFSFDSSMGSWGPMLNDIYYVKGPADTLKLSGMWWSYNINGHMAQLGFGSQYVKDGDFVKWGDESIQIVNDTNSYGYPSDVAWTTTVTPVYVPDAKIDASDIVYWVGTGSNEVVFAVNWANPDTCLAWGYRFSTDSVLVSDMMNDIQAADSRFSFDSLMGSYGPYLIDIYFLAGADTLKLAGNYWTYNVNGDMAQLGFGEQYVKNGDFVKFGDESVGFANDSAWGYPSNVVWTTRITPVSAPQQQGLATADPIDFNVYPNPATTQATIAVESTGKGTQIVLLDVCGKELYRTDAENDGNYTVNVSALPKGVYFVSVRNNDTAKTTKLIVK